MYYLTDFKYFVSIFPSFSIQLTPFSIDFKFFDPSFLQKLRSDWVYFFFHVLYPGTENLMKYPPQDPSIPCICSRGEGGLVYFQNQIKSNYFIALECFTQPNWVWPIIWQSPVTDHSLSSDQIYNNTPSLKCNPMHDYM